MVGRDLALAGVRATADPPAPPVGARVGRGAARGARGGRRRRPARRRRTTSSSPTRRSASLDPNLKMNPPLRSARRPQGAARRPAGWHDHRHRHRPRTARPAREGRPVRGSAVRRHRARDGLRLAEHAPRRAGAPSAGHAARADVGRAGACVRAGAAADRGRRAARISSCSTPEATWRVGEDGFRSRSANSWLLGETLEGRVRLTVAAGRVAYESVKRLPRARGRRPSSAASRSAPRASLRRGRLRDRDDRLPGARHRPELRGADPLLHGADGRQLRRRREPLGVEAAPTCAASSCARRGGRRGRTGCCEHGVVALDGRRHALARPAPARPRARCGRRSSPTRRTRTRRSTRSEQPPMEGRALVARRLDARAVRLRRARPAATSRSSTTGRSARSSGGSPARAQRSRSIPHDVDADELAALRRRRALERAGRPRAARRGDGGRARPRRPRARVRHLPRPPAARRSRPATRPSSCRSATAARTTRCSSARPAACSSPRRTTASRSSRRTMPRRPRSRSTTARSRGFDFPELSARSVQFHPEAGPGPHDGWPLLETWVEEVVAAAAALTSSRSA